MSAPQGLPLELSRLRSPDLSTSLASAANASFHRTGSDASYHEQIALLAHKDIDYKNLSRHLVAPEDSLRMQGGDVARHLYQQLDNGSAELDGAAPATSAAGSLAPRVTRLASFSKVLDQRRELTALDINVPGGFRREFIINKALQQHQLPPSFLTANFIEFLSIYGHFAGENFNDDDGASTSSDDAVCDEESSLLGAARHAYVHPPPPRRHPGPPRGTTSVLKTFFLVFKALVGSGILFLPRAFYNGGLGFLVFALALFGVLTFLCYVVLIELKRAFKLALFGELAYRTHGSALKYCVLFSIVLSQIGFVATYILFTAENMISFCHNFLRWHGPWVTTGNIVLVQCVLLIPLFWIRNLNKLLVVLLVLLVFIVVGLVIIFYYLGLQLASGWGPNIRHFNAQLWPMLIGVAVTLFEGIGLILPIEASMREPRQFTRVIGASMAVITLLFIAVGTIGYAAFGDRVKLIIILNLPQSHPLVQLIQVLYLAAVFLSAPLQIFPVTKIVESTIFTLQLFFKRDAAPRKDDDGRLYRVLGKYSTGIKWLKNLVRAVTIVVVSAIAYFNSNNIDRFILFNGCFACIPLVYIYPPLIHLQTFKLRPPRTAAARFLRVFDHVLIVTGVVCVVYTTYQIVAAE
jgi:proton-coupled amino acid transporter